LFLFLDADLRTLRVLPPTGTPDIPNGIIMVADVPYRVQLMLQICMILFFLVINICVILLDLRTSASFKDPVFLIF